MALPPPSAAERPHPAVAALRDAERIIVRLRWLAMASWLPILLRIRPPVPAVWMWAIRGHAALRRDDPRAQPPGPRHPRHGARDHDPRPGRHSDHLQRHARPGKR